MYQMLIAMLASKKSKKGQGVIEYAGALVIAAAIVAGVLLVGPDGMKTLFSTVLSKVSATFTAAL